MKTAFFALLFPLIALCQNTELRNSLRTQNAPFYHGVASGDPLHDRVIIWTRVTPEQIDQNLISVKWRMALDANMTEIISSGQALTGQAKDYTVKVDVINLKPGTCYFFDFEFNGARSAVGRTRTADMGKNDNVRFAVVSCANYQHGYFNVYKSIAERDDLHAVLHLGDYIYEYGVGVYSANMADRLHAPIFETVSLDDYRLRYAHYRLDKDLQDAHQKHPFICVWDDHESANDSWVNGAQNHQPTTEGPWAVRKNNAVQAYFEWMPIRETSFEKSIYRKIEYGDLVNLYMLDTRLEGRMQQIQATSPSLNNIDRTILGATQKLWLKEQLLNSTAKWNLIGQQVMMAPLKNAFGFPLFTDLWDGYPVERDEILNFFQSADIKNVVVLTGDFHTSWANQLPASNYNPSTGEGVAAVEFVTTSINSPSIQVNLTPQQITQINPHINWFDLEKRGYVLVDVKADQTQAEWYFNENVYAQNAPSYFARSFVVKNGEKNLLPTTQPSIGSTTCVAPSFAALVEEKLEEFTLFGVYPNPFTDHTLLHMGSSINQKINIGVYDVHGKEVLSPFDLDIEAGNSYFKIYGQDIPSGSYLLQINAVDQIKNHWIVRE